MPTRSTLTPRAARAATWPARRSVPIGLAPPSGRNRHAPQPKARPRVRIIGGQWKRTRLPVPTGPACAPRPTACAKPCSTGWARTCTGWRCLDAFAGTGALGLEAASRGAAPCSWSKSDAALVAQLHALQQRLEAIAVRVQRGNGIAALKQAAPGSIDLVLIDPPFESPLFEPAVEAAAKAVSADGFVYLEAPRAWTDEELAPHGLAVSPSPQGWRGACPFA